MGSRRFPTRGTPARRAGKDYSTTRRFAERINVTAAATSAHAPCLAIARRCAAVATLWRALAVRLKQTTNRPRRSPPPSPSPGRDKLGGVGFRLAFLVSSSEPLDWLTAMCYSPAMSHSVESHLQLQITEYDQLIRRFIPRYDEMLDEAVYLIRDTVGDTGKLVDLGIGTGALAERIIRAIPKAQIIGIDADAQMLEEAARRLSPDRTELRLQDFFSDLTTTHNAYNSCLYFIEDAMFEETESNQKRKCLAAHLVSAGFAEAEAFYHLQSWRKEDTYFALETELELLRKAGFSECDVAWRYGPMAVIVGKKPTWNI